MSELKTVDRLKTAVRVHGLRGIVGATSIVTSGMSASMTGSDLLGPCQSKAD